MIASVERALNKHFKSSLSDTPVTKAEPALHNVQGGLK
jgi:hypothetical protein